LAPRRTIGIATARSRPCAGSFFLSEVVKANYLVRELFNSRTLAGSLADLQCERLITPIQFATDREHFYMSRNLHTALPGFCAAAMLLLSTVAAEDHLPYERLEASGCVLLLDWRGSFSTAQQEKMKTWLLSAVETVSLLHGAPPRPEIRISLQPYSAKSAVPFARVLRNDPEGVLFYVNPDRPLDEYINDWTAYHEMSHLFIPYPGKKDIWFSEGLASYYQNVLQARAGLLTVDEAREKLRAGFARGKNDSKHAQLTLGELSPVMLERHAFMRVYWSGALYFLQADLLLRDSLTEEHSSRTLDDVLQEFGQCCLNTAQTWSGLAIAAEFDRISDTDIFTTLYAEYARSTAIPDYETLLDSAQLESILTP
jgi:hypothetical protein